MGTTHIRCARDSWRRSQLSTEPKQRKRPQGTCDPTALLLPAPMNRKPGQLQNSIPDFTTSLAWVKLVSAGFPASGKTCIIKHFCDSRFSQAYQPTVGADYGFKVSRINGFDLRVNLWDLSGYPEYVEVRNELYAGCDGVLLTVDLTDSRSLGNVDAWMREIQQSFGAQDRPEIVLLANKADLRDRRQVTSADAAKVAAKHLARLFETSAATGEGVDNAFRDLLERIVQRNRAAWVARGVKAA